MCLPKLEDARAVPLLIQRYKTEDADVRWFTLKAMSYIGSEDGLKLAEDEGPGDENNACKQLAEDITDLGSLVQPPHDAKYD